ncbi:hypothetical protein HON01_04400 [Candidatus Woesearchaeota archaeon]|nr:hypothetical protein [Candidatus Woesearchaeota archaeon]
MAPANTRKKATRKKKFSGKAKAHEDLDLEIRRVERRIKEGNSLIDFSNGYAHFIIYLLANNKPMEIEKRIRLDKPEKMLRKFLSKIEVYAETRHKERKYFISQKPAPDKITTTITNKDTVADGMITIFEKINQFLKTKKASQVKTTVLVFK